MEGLVKEGQGRDDTGPVTAANGQVGILVLLLRTL